MNKEEILVELEKGSKVRHQSYTDLHWIKKHPLGRSHYINGVKDIIRISNFWKYKTASKWDKDWFVVD